MGGAQIGAVTRIFTDSLALRWVREHSPEKETGDIRDCKITPELDTVVTAVASKILGYRQGSSDKAK